MRLAGVDPASVEQLQKLGAQLKAADKAVRREMYAAVRKSAAPVQTEMRTAAQDYLPSGGGLGAWVAALTVRVRQSYSGRRAGIALVGHLTSGGSGKAADLGAINRGRVMHYAWGKRKKGGGLFGPQSVRGHFWDDTAKGPVMKRAKADMLAALQRARGQIISK